jgi:hypothetical protein
MWPRSEFEELSAQMAWSAWVAIGVGGWSSDHDDWAIDPEPLILFTAFLDDLDGRLQDEATDWCVRNWRSISKVRLRNLARETPDDVREPFNRLSATVSHHAGVAWPGASEAEPRPFRVTGKSATPDLTHEAAAWLRLRTMFGLSARAEILRYFLSRSGGRATASRLATASGYRKRNMADECEVLVRAGVLDVRTGGRIRLYGLVHRTELEAFAGDLPPVRPDWGPIFSVARRLVLVDRTIAQAPSDLTVPVHARKALDDLMPSLEALDIKVAIPRDPERLWPAVQKLGRETLGRWAVGEWDGHRFD